MKSLIILSAFALIGLTGCDPDSVQLHEYGCPNKPVDIPDTLSNGKTVYWDCAWQQDYNAGRVKVILNEDGSARAVKRWH